MLGLWSLSYSCINDLPAKVDLLCGEPNIVNHYCVNLGVAIHAVVVDAQEALLYLDVTLLYKLKFFS